ELSKVQRERSSKIQSRHRSGRSGMVNVREAVKKDLEVADPPCHCVWIISRTKSRKLVTDYDKGIAEKIRNAAEQEEEGELAGEAYVPQPYAPEDEDYDDSHARFGVEITQEGEIPIPIEGCRYVRDVSQMFLPWPKHLILTTEGPLAQPPSRRDASKGKAPMLSSQGGGAREDDLFTEEKMALIPNSLKWMIREFLRLKDKRDIITIPVPRGFIAPRTQITLSREDLREDALDASGGYAKENYPFKPCKWPPNSRRNRTNDRK
uniref:Uncharacterized protein n=1 Tax=Cannabis sativa TaxID=3483 RepID=A0A803Q6B1_CANSA